MRKSPSKPSAVAVGRRAPVPRARTRPCVSHPLVELPIQEIHPLRMFLLSRGVSLQAGARYLGWSLRKLMNVLGEWSRPRDAARVEYALGVDEGSLFPARGEVLRK